MSDDARYLHGHHDSVLRSHRWRTAENSAAYFTGVIEPEWIILDLGCGPGTITHDLAALVPKGRVIGIDVSTTVLLEAKDVSPSTPLVAADLYQLPFAENSIDAIHLHMVLQHLPDPVGALRVLRRLLRPGGVLAARDSDYGAFSWDPNPPALEEWLALYERAARAVGGEPDAGRFLSSWAAEAGFEDVTSSWSSWVYESPEDRFWWGSLWADRVVSSAFAETVLGRGLADHAHLTSLSEAWRAWARSPEGRFEIPSGEILCRK